MKSLLKILDIIIRILRPKPRPEPEPTPEPEPPSTGPYISGEARIRVTGLDKLPMAPERDDFVLCVLEWESHNFTTPILGIHVRGTGKRNAGALIRWMPSRRLADAEEEAQKEIRADGGINYHRRVQRATDGVYTLSWDEYRHVLTLPNGKKLALAHTYYGTAGYGSMRMRLRPRRDEPYHLWQGFEAARHGVKIELISVTGNPGELEPLPSPPDEGT